MAKKVQILFFVAPFIFLTLAFSGKYNVFEGFYNSQHGKYSASRIENDGDKVEYDAAADTRTFIYVDVIASALNNDYVLMGRTLARGNDCSYSRFADETYYLTRRYERYANEVGMTNIFTWLGLIGLFFYIMIYLNASLKGMYKSNNIYIKCLSCLLAYHCMYGWVENYPAFTMHTVTLWMLIGMCASPMFREMTDMEFESWLMKIFKR